MAEKGKVIKARCKRIAMAKKKVRKGEKGAAKAGPVANREPNAMKAKPAAKAAVKEAPKMHFHSTAEIPVPAKLIDWIIGQERGVRIIKKAAAQRRNVLLMGGDELPEDYEAPRGFNVTLGIDDPAQAERVFAALAENGTMRMPLQPTFRALRFGMVTDRFGIPWMINCEKST